MAARHVKWGDLGHDESVTIYRSRVRVRRRDEADEWLSNNEAGDGRFSHSKEWLDLGVCFYPYEEFIFDHYPTFFDFNLRYGGLSDA